MTSLQESRSPQLQIPRGSPSSTLTKSPGQLPTACLVGSSNSPSPARKRVHPNYLKIDDAVPPNKKLHTPTKEEKETLKKERGMLYKRLAEEKRTPYYLTPQPIFPIPLSNLYSFFQHQHAVASPPQTLPANLTFSPSAPVDFSQTKLGPNLVSCSSTLTTNSPGSLVGNTAGISGLPTPGGSSVGTPPRAPFTAQFYPTPLLKYPFSPPTPSSLGLRSPWSLSNRSLSMSSSTTTTGPPSNGSQVGDGASMLQCLTGSDSNDGKASAFTTVPPRKEANKNGVVSSSKEQSSDDVESQTHSPPKNGIAKSDGTTVITGITPENWTSNLAASPGSAIFQNNPHLKSSHLPHSGLVSIHSPLSLSQTPYSPAMQVCSPCIGSVSSCPSVSSSSGCSSASENQDNPPSNSSLANVNYVLTEYHVGPHRLISEKDMDDQSEGATNSGRNTPSDGTAGDSASTNMLLSSEVAEKLTPSEQSISISGHRDTSGGSVPGSSHLPLPNLTKSKSRSKNSRTKPNSPYPFSVESMSSGCQPSPMNSQGYVSGCHMATDRPSSGVSSMSSSLSSRDSTPEPDDLKHDPHHPPQGSDVFCLVPGRLSLLSSTQKYRVTVDEVRRRLSHPECLNASVLGGILRRAKSKNGGTVLRQRLQGIGVSLPPGRRKQTELSLLTSLVESEALHLSGDFHRICENYFPHIELAQIIARQHTGTPEAQHRISMVKATQLIVSELQAMLDAVGGPSNIRPSDPNNPYPGLTNFSLLTHGFGNPSINTGLGVLQTYLQELLAFYEGRKSVQTTDNRYNMFDEQAPSSSSQSLGMGSGGGLIPESVSIHGNNMPQHHHHPNGIQPNPLEYAARHYPGVNQEVVSCSNTEEVAVEVALKEEPIESPSAYTT